MPTFMPKQTWVRQNAAAEKLKNFSSGDTALSLGANQGLNPTSLSLLARFSVGQQPARRVEHTTPRLTVASYVFLSENSLAFAEALLYSTTSTNSDAQTQNQHEETLFSSDLV